MASQTSSLLKLPAELKAEICEYAMLTPRPNAPAVEHVQGFSILWAERKAQKHLALAYTCKELTKPALDAFFNVNTVLLAAYANPEEPIHQRRPVANVLDFGQLDVSPDPGQPYYNICYSIDLPPLRLRSSIQHMLLRLEPLPRNLRVCSIQDGHMYDQLAYNDNRNDWLQPIDTLLYHRGFSQLKTLDVEISLTMCWEMDDKPERAKQQLMTWVKDHLDKFCKAVKSGKVKVTFIEDRKALHSRLHRCSYY